MGKRIGEENRIKIIQRLKNNQASIEKTFKMLEQKNS